MRGVPARTDDLGLEPIERGRMNDTTEGVGWVMFAGIMVFLAIFRTN